MVTSAVCGFEFRVLRGGTAGGLYFEDEDEDEEECAEFFCVLWALLRQAERFR
jgi:hypothetical protein